MVCILPHCSWSTNPILFDHRCVPGSLCLGAIGTPIWHSVTSTAFYCSSQVMRPLRVKGKQTLPPDGWGSVCVQGTGVATSGNHLPWHCSLFTHTSQKVVECYLIKVCGASLVMQWLRIHLPMQGTRALVQEDPTCRGATKPVCHNYWARVPQLLSPRA